jgi:hypothetical protein
VIGKIIAAERRCDNLPYLQREWQLIQLLLSAWGYPDSFVCWTVDAWLRKRQTAAATPPPEPERHSALSQDLLGEGFVVIDHCESFRPGAVQTAIETRMGLAVQIAVRYHPSVAATLSGLHWKHTANDSLPVMRSFQLTTPAALSHLWDAAANPKP